MNKKLLLMIVLIISIYKGHVPIVAAEFSINQDINYECTSSEICIVSSNIRITNNTNEKFVSEYELNTGLKEISEISALDYKNRALLTEVNSVDNQSNIKINLENPILGQGSITEISIKYKTKETIKHTGKIWEISIPKIKKTEEIEDVKVTVSVPNDFESLMYVTPSPISKKDTNSIITYAFDSETTKDGINIVFGEYQLFNFEIYYYLESDSHFWSKTIEVPFPPNIEEVQKVFISRLNIEPESLIIDKEGNYIAQYKLDPGQTKRVEIYGLIQIFNKEIDPAKGGRFEDMPKNYVEEYTKQQRYWESQDTKIIDIANSLIDKDKTISENAKEVYIYTTSNLEYSVEKTSRDYLERLGALKALQNPQDSVCMEFTDLTIALLRAMGIPAREINGYAYSEDLVRRPLSVFYDNNKDLLHSWVEFFDPKFGWVEIDSTWGQTSGLDFFSKLGVNHIVFVRKGNPEYPIPPGVYKDTASNKKSVIITFGNEKLLNGDLKNLDSFVDKNKKSNLLFITLIVLSTAPALYMIYLVLKGLLTDPRK